MLDTSPLRALLRDCLDAPEGKITGIGRNLENGRIEACALTTLRYATGQTVTWSQGRQIPDWQRPDRVGVSTELDVEHIMASAALPLVFPAVRLDGEWYGDGGIRMSAPLAPAIHLGAERILAISTRYKRSPDEATEATVSGYPPPAIVVGSLMNAVFLDALDADAQRLERINSLLRKIPRQEHGEFRPIRLLTLRPSSDLGRLAADYEHRLPRPFRFMTRGLGTKDTKSPDFLSLFLFQPDYLQRLVEMGEADAEARLDEIKSLLVGP
jgi:NTE family protein